MSHIDLPGGPLDGDQRARAEAARVARDCLAPRPGIAGGAKPDAYDVQHLAEWIVYGPDVERWAELMGGDPA